ncbi:NH(3)-dependent NAD(+) synthetase [Salsuginibacillus halophilus]|uniref:NH(3)-dependent NAD(+) synthetase n=1 Tax=Salsuginibacillus halophilus TaxID=517424 RepID=A0A2P8HYM2_9BACI|nr:ammonia-dependent NAD(+) synthetase [Salsuginibacillus halophilus]PSL51331.1 NH(3)-dependent NAD(+) synthetase [Salsuginibacillus halophilus]
MGKTQNEIIRELDAKSSIYVEEEIRKRVDFLKTYAKTANVQGFVLGISGGQDSALAGVLAQQAVNELNEAGGTYAFTAARLPYGEQVDEDDAAAVMKWLAPDRSFDIDIAPAVDAAEKAFEAGIGQKMSDFNKGNTKARERMKIQYDLAAEFSSLVVGTDHAAEAVTGFFTKFGDGACDVAPLFGLNKRQGKELLAALDAPEFLRHKEPTADLESDKPALPDEEALGMTYDQIDDFLEGKTVPSEIHDKIIRFYERTEHKRQPPVTVYDSWWKQLNN